MDYDVFNQLVNQHKNSMILIGILVLIFVIIGFFVVEFYVRQALECQYFEFGKMKISPTLLMIIPLMFVVIYFPIKVYECDYDINNMSYEIYVGEVEYSESSVKLRDEGISIFVGKGHEICPRGINYGKVVYSSKSHVIVYFEYQTPLDVKS